MNCFQMECIGSTQIGMKICKVNNYTAPAKHAQGAQMVLEALSYQFQKDGHEISLLLNNDSKCDFGKLV